MENVSFVLERTVKIQPEKIVSIRHFRLAVLSVEFRIALSKLSAEQPSLCFQNIFNLMIYAAETRPALSRILTSLAPGVPDNSPVPFHYPQLTGVKIFTCAHALSLTENFSSFPVEFVA